MFNYVYKDLEVAHKLDERLSAPIDCKKHHHDFYEIFFFIGGNVEFSVKNEKKQLEPFDILFIQPGENHFVTFLDENTPYERYVLKFQDYFIPEFLKSFLLNRTKFFTPPPPAKNDMIPDANSYNTDTFKELFIKLDDFSEIYDIKELRLLFTGIITELLIKLSHSNWQKRTDTVLDNDITSIVKYINENIRSSFTLQDLCGKFDLSQTTLYNNFHTYMKVPIMKYIREKKIIQANQLILKGEKPMAVATSFGYADYSSFYRSFVSVMGFAPSQHNKNSDD